MSDLISVRYTDLTTYNDTTSGDVLGCPIEYHWGPVDQLQVLGRVEFFETYQESLPKGATPDSTTLSRYYGYAQIKKAFELGMPKVEVVRPRGNYKWQSFTMSSTTPVLSLVDADTPFVGVASSWLQVSLKYPGFLPNSMVGNYDTIGCQVLEFNNVITINVVGIVSNAISAVIETFEGSGVVGDTLDGQKYFIEDVVNANSNYIQCNYIGTGTHNCHTSTTFTKFVNLGDTHSGSTIAYPTAIADTTTQSVGNWSYYLSTYYSDFFTSSCTLLISPTNSGVQHNIIKAIAEQRQTCLGVYGYPLSETFTKTAITTFNSNTPKSKFCLFVVGREKVSVFSVNIASNCVGGWCGATANVAKTAKLNQLASAFSYGAYSGSLTNTLSLTDANDLIKSGVISVISAKNGNYIWGTRDQYSKTTSFYARANVMRVVAYLLSNAFPIALDALHTDASTDPLTKSVFQGRFTSLVDDLVATHNLQVNSKADVMGEINSDRNTQGGKIFNVVFTCYFIGLTEEVVINIVATDNSVTANIQ